MNIIYGMGKAVEKEYVQTDLLISLEDGNVTISATDDIVNVSIAVTELEFNSADEVIVSVSEDEVEVE
jgi:hypothetical protein